MNDVDKFLEKEGIPRVVGSEDALRDVADMTSADKDPGISSAQAGSYSASAKSGSASDGSESASAFYEMGLDPAHFVNLSGSGTVEVSESMITVAEAFSRVWNSAYETVMYQTRDHEKAEAAAEQAWLLFVEFLEADDKSSTEA